MSRPPRILQFGSGVFLRGFVDWMVQRMNRDGRYDGGVVLSKLTPGGGLDAYERSQGRYTHVLRGVRDGAVVDEAETIDCLRAWLNPFEEWERFLELALSPTLDVVVSNSTEAGIRYEPQAPPAVCPPGFPARLCAFLHARFQTFEGAPSAGLVHIPCELIEDNGQRLREIVLRHAADWELGPEFRAWVEQFCPFVDTLVDRIVTPLDEEGRRELAQLHSCDPSLLNASEPYWQFVLRGDRDAVESRLPLEACGFAQWTEDLAPWRERKVRILNGAHTAMVGLGVLGGLETVLDCTKHPATSAFVRSLVHDEIVPSAPGDATELHGYAEKILERFENPFLRHRLTDIGLHSLAKAEVRLFPTLRDFHQRTGGVAERCCFALAASLRFMRASGGDGGEDGVRCFTEVDGRRTELRDDPQRLEELQSAWAAWSVHRETEKFVGQVLGSSTLWNRPVADVPGVSWSVARHLSRILEVGAVRAVETALEP